MGLTLSSETLAQMEREMDEQRPSSNPFPPADRLSPFFGVPVCRMARYRP